MLKKIKGSIFLKMFLSIALILMISSLAIYGIVMVAMPQSYKTQSDRTFTVGVDQLIEELEKVTYKEGETIIDQFCLKNNATVTLISKEGKQTFGDISLTEAVEEDQVGMSKTIGSAVKFTDSDETYTIMIGQQMKVVSQITEVFWRLLPWITLLILIISLIGAYICSAIFAKPVLEISRISKKMSEADTTWHCDVSRTDELGVLALSLNTMVQKLNTTMNDLETANYQLQEDIQRERKQELQRRAFFAAVSHELKTPITILKGQLESMIYRIGEYKDRDKYLPLSLHTVERMENLVKEILTISRLTSDGFRLTRTTSNVKQMMQDCIISYQPLASKKKITLHLEVLAEPVLEVDKKLLEKAFSNIVGNGVLYSPEGANVTATLTESMLSVENTGVHIPEEKLTDVFTPLFRVEESRNQHTGGSGLGLYIVKNILDLHHMKFEIKNCPDGVCFTVWLNHN